MTDEELQAKLVTYFLGLVDVVTDVTVDPYTRGSRRARFSRPGLWPAGTTNR